MEKDKRRQKRRQTIKPRDKHPLYGKDHAHKPKNSYQRERFVWKGESSDN